MTQTPLASSKRKFRSINVKLSLIMVAVLFVCMSGIMLFFLANNLKNSIQAEQERLNSLGGIYRAVLSQPVANLDQTKIRDALRSLRDIPSIRQALVRDVTGKALAEMGGGAVLDRTVLDSGRFGLAEILTHETVRIESEIVLGGKKVGSLRLIADISWVIEQFWLQVGVAIAISSTIVALAWFFGTVLINRASRKLSTLATGLADIGTKDTLEYKFSRESNDEVGILVDAFNDMMSRIHQRDVALRTYNENLEVTVADRTRDLVIARDEAESANAAKSEFLAMMSHEIRTPMNGMMVMAQMLAAAPLSPRHLRFAEIINRSGQNLLALMNDVLDISKIEAGRLTIESNPFSIDAILADLHGLFYERAREKSIAISYAVSPSVPVTLIGDATRLNQVITNLVNNALKFTERGGVEIIADTKDTPDGKFLSIQVKDTGIGIAQDKLALVFERFTQADQSITRRFGGTGLGLAISRRLVEAMGGEISVTSQEGHGSVFEFTVLIEHEGTMPDAEQLKNLKIKLLMNNDLHRQSLVHNLTAYGALISTDEAEANFDLVLSDNPSIVDGSKSNALFLEPSADHKETGYKGRARAVLPYPVTREKIQLLAQAIENNDFIHLHSSHRNADRIQSYAHFRGLRALAVDDNTVNREVLCEALSSMEVEVETAVDGEDAVAKAKANNYDIIFMDCSMPVMDGFTATRILRNHEKGTGQRTPIVAITALTQNARKDDWRNAGMDSWISKPFTIPSVAERISALVLKTSALENDPADQGSDSQLLHQFRNVPLLDEQTVSMIIRLGSSGKNPAIRKIHEIFCTLSTQAVNDLMKSGKSDLEQTASLAHHLKSISISIGASKLSALAAFVEEGAKSGRTIPDTIYNQLQNAHHESLRTISSRFGLMITPHLSGQIRTAKSA